MTDGPALHIDARMLRVRDTLLAAAAALPSHEQILELRRDFAPALERGWFHPSEDEQIRRLFADYLHVRAALHECLAQIRPAVRLWLPGDANIPAFTLAWTAGCMLMRAARYSVREFRDVKPIRTLLNQAEPRFGIPEGMFDTIHVSATRPATVLSFLRAARYAEKHRAEISALREHPDLAALPSLLEAEAPYIEQQVGVYSLDMLQNRWQRLCRKPDQTYRGVMRGIFESSGRVIAECRNPFHRKRVHRRTLELVEQELQPGDVLLTRHDDALSNLFLPGFWPHGALILGRPDQLAELSLPFTAEQTRRLPPGTCTLEAKKDGVRFRPLSETLAVDAFLLLRPNVEDPEILRSILERAITHEGKPYDFEFDFTRADRLVCTEVIYRSFDGLGPFSFELDMVAGRLALPAVSWLRQVLDRGLFKPVLAFGLRGNQVYRGTRATEMTLRTI